MGKKFLKSKLLKLFAIGTLGIALIPAVTVPNEVHADGSGPWTFNITNTANGAFGGISNSITDGTATVNNGIYYWTVPYTGTYTIKTEGAKGGMGSGGFGASMTGDFTLQKGAVLKLLVGQAATYVRGGGGGTYVTNIDNTALIVAGGGGGKGNNGGISDAKITIDGKAERGLTWGCSAGEAGSGGSGGQQGGAHGAGGLKGDGLNSANTQSGKSFINGGNGGHSNNNYQAGFGGGSTGTSSYGGAGGGYSGGGGGGWDCDSDNPYYHGGGGGGSWNTGSSQINVKSTRTAEGIVEINLKTVVPNLISPMDNSTTGNHNVTLTWSPITQAIKHEIRIGTTPGSSNILAPTNKGTINTHIFAVPAVSTNQDYYWAVRTETASGWGDWTESSKFTFVPPTIATMSPGQGSSFQDSFINIGWTPALGTGTSVGEYEIKAGTTSGGTDILPVTSKGTVTTHKLLVPESTPGNTTIYVSVRAKTNLGYWGPWGIRTVVFSNNVPVISGTFTTGEKDLTVSLDKRIMNFKIASLVDPDDFNYVKVFGEVVGVAGSKKQLGANLTGPVSWTAKNYKLKLVPDFQPTGSTYDLLVVDSANENTVIATLIDNRPMQASNASSPESFTFRFFAEDYQNTTNGVLSTSNLVTQAITIDTRNYLPRTYSVTHDVNNRIMSANQGFNRVKVSGTVEDLDPADGIDVYYTVKLATDLVAGKYVVNPATDTKISTIPSNGTVARGTFNATYTITESLANGNYVLLVYGKDTRGGIGDPTIINFTVNKTNPDIRFYSQYGGNTLATAQRQILAKNSKLKMYFSAYDFTTFEYAGYVVRPNQQTTTGSYEDLKIRGAFTNDVPSQFIGVDLSDPLFNKGDMLVFKFRAISSTGVKIEKDVRILIGDQNNTMTDVGDARVPTPLRVQ